MRFKRLRIELDNNNLVNLAFREQGMHFSYYAPPWTNIRQTLRLFNGNKTYLTQDYYAS